MIWKKIEIVGKRPKLGSFFTCFSMRKEIALSFLGGCFNLKVVTFRGSWKSLFEQDLLNLCPNQEQPYVFHQCMFQTHKCVTAKVLSFFQQFCQTT